MKNETVICYHCSRDYDLDFDVVCDFGQGLPHCGDHRAECAQCHVSFCQDILSENEDGELLCDECQIIVATPVVKAAMRAARTGTHRDLKAYLKVRFEDKV